MRCDYLDHCTMDETPSCNFKCDYCGFCKEEIERRMRWIKSGRMKRGQGKFEADVMRLSLPYRK